MLSCVFSFRAKGSWMGKDSLFVGPIGPILKWLGGIPIDRSKHGKAVEQAVGVMNDSNRLLMVVSPEGTRSRVNKWKTGFYYIALGAKVPIVLGIADYRRKMVGFGPAFMPTGKLRDDMKVLFEFYRDITPKHPDLFSLPDLPESI
jgi:1-acyl-sn-glycerol-3-phosphate acyltransferase